MARKYLAFDLETASTVASDNWRTCRPLGITCAAALRSDDPSRPLWWHGMTDTGTPAPRMTRDEARCLVDDLTSYVEQGYTLLTWNGAGFDFDVLAEEAQALAACRRLAVNHVDMMFYVLCRNGYPIGIDNTAKAMGISAKPDGMSGELAPQLWAEGQYEAVLAYVVQDVRMALEIAEASEAGGALQWVTRRGQTRTFRLPTGWLTVRDANALPIPDTSWMTASMGRDDVLAWCAVPGQGDSGVTGFDAGGSRQTES